VTLEWFVVDTLGVVDARMVRGWYARCRWSSASSDVVRERVQCYVSAQFNQSNVHIHWTSAAQTQLRHQLGLCCLHSSPCRRLVHSADKWFLWNPEVACRTQGFNPTPFPGKGSSS